MFRIFKGLIITVVLGLICREALNYYLGKNLSTNLEEARSTVDGFPDIHYDQFNLHINGSFSLSDLTIIPTEDSPIQGIRIEKLTATFPSLLYVAKQAFANTFTPPDSFKLKLQGFELNGYESISLFGPYTTEINQLLAQQASPVCGDSFFMTDKDLQAMGYESWKFDAELSYVYEPSSQKMTVSLEALLPTLGSVKESITLSNVNAVNPKKLTSKPAIEKALLLEFTGHNYIKNKINYCAKKAGISTTEYIQQETSQPDIYYQLTLGINPTHSFREAYREFLQNPQIISLLAMPSPGFDANRLSKMPINHWSEFIGLSLQINESFISPLEMKPQQLVDLITIAANQHSPEGHARREQQDRTFEKYVYRAIEKNALADALQQHVRITTDHKVTYEGVILSADSEMVVIQQWVSGGYATLPINLEQVMSVEVMEQINE